MGRREQEPTVNDFNSVSAMSVRQKAYTLYLYLYGNRTRMEDVGGEVFGGSGSSASMQPSAVMRCYGFSGQNGNYFRKKRYELELKDFEDFVRKYPYGCNGDWPNHRTIDDFMKKRHEQRQKVVQQVDEQKEQEVRANRIEYEAPKYKTTVNQDLQGERYSNTDSVAAGGGALAIGGLIFIAILFFGLKALVGFIGSATGITYYLDQFSYKEYTVVGNKAVTNPKGLGMRFTNLEGGEYAIGYLRKDQVNDYAVVYDGRGVLQVGKYKKTKAKGWCVEEDKNNGTIAFANMKSGKKKGYGILAQNGEIRLVKFGKTIDKCKVIATYNGHDWVNDKGKSILKNNKYKGITFIDGTHFKVDDIEVTIDNGFFCYEISSKDNFRISGSYDSLYYENEIKNGLVFCCEYNMGSKLHIEEIDILNYNVLGEFNAIAE